MATEIRRTSGKAVGKRLRNYPIDTWLTGTWWSAIQDEDFRVTRTVFQQDLHNLARRQTTLAAAGGKTEGWIVETSMAGLPEEEIQFCFSQRPFDQCPGYRAPRYTVGARKEQKVGTKKSDWCVWFPTPPELPHKFGEKTGCPLCDLEAKAGEAQPATAPALPFTTDMSMDEKVQIAQEAARARRDAMLADAKAAHPASGLKLNEGMPLHHNLVDTSDDEAWQNRRRLASLISPETTSGTRWSDPASNPLQDVKDAIQAAHDQSQQPPHQPTEYELWVAQQAEER